MYRDELTLYVSVLYYIIMLQTQTMPIKRGELWSYLEAGWVEHQTRLFLLILCKLKFILYYIIDPDNGVK